MTTGSGVWTYSPAPLWKSWWCLWFNWIS